MSRRHCAVLDLADDPALIADYEARHAPGAVWPRVIAHIRAQGVEAMEIWRAGDRLVMIAEVADDYPRPVPAPPDRLAPEQKPRLGSGAQVTGAGTSISA